MTRLPLCCAAALTIALCAPGCSTRTEPPIHASPVSPVVPVAAHAIKRADVLLDIDNSRSMGDKQRILAEAIPELVRALANPPCVPVTGPAPTKPIGPLDTCPPGTSREIPPIRDIHIGVISSSLGGHGSDACQNVGENDRGALIAHSEHGIPIATYDGKGFLAWDPGQELSPPGEADLEQDSAADPGDEALSPSLRDLVIGVGQAGCGYESQLESWYRFLVEPEPYDTITVEDNKAVMNGVDKALLAQRADFLRPDSLLVIAVLSDENDCSMHEGGQFFFAAQQFTESGDMFHLPAPRSECAADPNDPCCRSCGQSQGDCPDDPSCFNADGSLRKLELLEDRTNLRCFDMKRRFGIDFLYPLDRYTKALTETTVQTRTGDVVPNPLFSDLDPNDAISEGRDPEMVVFAAIVGVPWQDIARTGAGGTPDLRSGIDLRGKPAGGFKSALELNQPAGGFVTAWDVILGDPTSYVPAADPHMVESIDPRPGINPVTGVALAPPGSPDDADPINGREWNISGRDELQYACIFPLPPGQERDCLVGSAAGCECPPGNDSPLCAPSPANGGERTLQVRAPANPGLRELAVARAVGTKGVVGSACPAQLDTPDAIDYGYRPSIAAIYERVRELAARTVCQPWSLDPDAEGRVPCEVIEASQAEGACACDGPARSPVADAGKAMVEFIAAMPEAQKEGWDCFCEIEQLSGEGLAACQNDTKEPVTLADGTPVDGYCYIDAGTSPPTGNPEIVSQCPDSEKRTLRFVGDATARAGAEYFFACQAR